MSVCVCLYVFVFVFMRGCMCVHVRLTRSCESDCEYVSVCESVYVSV